VTFTVAILSRIDISLQTVQAIVVSPTRELARQIAEVIKEMGLFMNIEPYLAIPEDKIKPPAKKKTGKNE